MKMKKLSFTCLIATTLSICSCSDFLTETNYSGLSDDPVYYTEVGVEALVNSCYTPTRLWYGKEGGATLTELGTDLFLKGGDCKHPQFSMYNMDLNSQDPLLQVYWSKFYEAINYCNTALARLETAPLDEEVRIRRIGEVSFLLLPFEILFFCTLLVVLCSAVLSSNLCGHSPFGCLCAGYP